MSSFIKELLLAIVGEDRKRGIKIRINYRKQEREMDNKVKDTRFMVS